MSVSAARAAIDRAHAGDPEQRAGRPAELVYADAVEAWLRRLVPAPSDALVLAARAQHLERWTLPRSSYPMDRAGYHAWRTEQYRRQGARARELCRGAGIAAADAERVELLVAKRLLKEPDGQALEDAACLVFLESEVAGFASDHPDYTSGKYVDILVRTMRKMSAPARAMALALPLPEPFAGLVRTAAAALA
jgi:hypothetical protein